MSASNSGTVKAGKPQDGADDQQTTLRAAGGRAPPPALASMASGAAADAASSAAAAPPSAAGSSFSAASGASMSTSTSVSGASTSMSFSGASELDPSAGPGARASLYSLSGAPPPPPPAQGAAPLVGQRAQQQQQGQQQRVGRPASMAGAPRGGAALPQQQQQVLPQTQPQQRRGSSASRAGAATTRGASAGPAPVGAASASGPGAGVGAPGMGSRRSSTATGAGGAGGVSASQSRSRSRRPAALDSDEDEDLDLYYASDAPDLSTHASVGALGAGAGADDARSASGAGGGGGVGSGAGAGAGAGVDDYSYTRYGPLDEEDDEVTPRDRGEELVKRRMRARHREKQAKLKRLRAQQQQAQAAQQAAQQGQQGQQGQGQAQQLRHSRSSIGPGAGVLPPATSSPMLSPGPKQQQHALERDGRPTHISIPGYTSGQGYGQPGGALLSPAASPVAQRSASASTAGTGAGAIGGTGPGGSAAAAHAHGVYPSPHGHIRRPVSGAPGQGQGAPQGQGQGQGQAANRASLAPSHSQSLSLSQQSFGDGAGAASAGMSAGLSAAGSSYSAAPSASAGQSQSQSQAMSAAPSQGMSQSGFSSHGGTVVLGPGHSAIGEGHGHGHAHGPSAGTAQDVFSDDGRTHSEIRRAFGEGLAYGGGGGSGTAGGGYYTSASSHHDRSSYYEGADGADEDYFEERRDALAGLAHERARGSRQAGGDHTFDADGSEMADRIDGEDDGAAPGDAGEGGGDDDDDDDDADLDPDDVEYTLKDRQDAINIEHPFGLPIWKPALYKKSRSVTRNAETALHSTPSAAAERHLLPGNIAWTLLFGSWLSVLCFALATLVTLVPNGGARYARVLWELGGYIFWPFGKYVEVEVPPLSDERDAPYAPPPPSAQYFQQQQQPQQPHGYQQQPGYFDGADATMTPAAYASGGAHEGNDDGTYETAFTPVAARFPHDHTHHAQHQVPFNSRPASHYPHGSAGSASASADQQAESSSSRSNSNSAANSNNQSTPRQSVGDSSGTSQTATNQAGGDADADADADAEAGADETTTLAAKGKAVSTPGYGAIENGHGADALDAEAARIAREQGVYGYVLDDAGNDVFVSQRYAGRIAYGAAFGLLLAPLMGIVCLLCWGGVFSVPMGKLTWVLLRNLAVRPLALHFRSAAYAKAKISASGDVDEEQPDSIDASSKLRLLPGQRAPASKNLNAPGKAHRHSKILLCTYRAVGAQYYKYTVGGVNILFVNTIPLVFFTIFDFFFLEPYVEHHHSTGLLALVASQGVIFMMALGSVIPLSYFIGMAVASISAQSSIGMGAVINATFGSVIEIILYSIALTQNKAKLVEGSIIGSILAGVLLMPGLSMCSGATRRKEQRFNARSAGVTSTMLIMAIIGILTPTLFYQIYGTFQLTCEGCPKGGAPGENWTCKRCFYEHVPPSTDPFFQSSVKGLIYTCTVILVLSYAIGLWFSLRTHASQIWQNPQPQHHSTIHAVPAPVPVPVTSASEMANMPSAQRSSIYKRLIPASVYQQLLPIANRPRSQSTQGGTVKGAGRQVSTTGEGNDPPALQLPERFSEEDYARAVALTASAFHNAMYQQQQQQPGHSANQAMPRSAPPRHSLHEIEDDDSGSGGHDAPSWSRQTSGSVLLACTVLYAIIAEILVDVVDVVLDGSGIDEKFLGITLFALVPNTTEFMNAMSFAINGNIALSMEIGSAYALQVCLIQIPAMVVFSAYYNATHDFPGSVIHRTFTLIFPRWDVIAIIFSVFLLTYTYIEARSNYYRGSICILSYLVLVAGFFYAPASGDVEMPPDTPNLLSVSSYPVASGAFGAAPVTTLVGQTFGGLQQYADVPAMQGLAWLAALFHSLFAR